MPRKSYVDIGAQIQAFLENIFSEQLWQSNDQKNCERPNKEEDEGNNYIKFDFYSSSEDEDDVTSESTQLPKPKNNTLYRLAFIIFDSKRFKKKGTVIVNNVILRDSDEVLTCKNG